MKKKPRRTVLNKGFQEKKRPKHLKPTYLSNYLNKMKQNIKQFLNENFLNDQIMAKDVYLKKISSLKFT